MVIGVGWSCCDGRGVDDGPGDGPEHASVPCDETRARAHGAHRLHFTRRLGTWTGITPGIPRAAASPREVKAHNGQSALSSLQCRFSAQGRRVTVSRSLRRGNAVGVGTSAGDAPRLRPRIVPCVYFGAPSLGIVPQGPVVARWSTIGYSLRRPHEMRPLSIIRLLGSKPVLWALLPYLLASKDNHPNCAKPSKRNSAPQSRSASVLAAFGDR